MDYVRYYLAIAVVIQHYNIALGADIPWPMNSSSAVGAFFGLSGFLVYASYLKHPDIRTYIKNRALRIIPIYSFIVIFFAVLLCSISTLPVIEYFTDVTFWKYILANLCFLNFVQPTLPGVFDGLPINAVNGSLWTLKVEWALYLSIPFFFWFVRRFRLSVKWSIFVLFIFSVAYRYVMLIAYNRTENELYNILSYQFCGQLVYFYAGVLFYDLRNHIINHKAFIITVAAVIMSGFCLLGDCDSVILELLAYLMLPVALVWLILSLSILPADRLHIPAISNYSYELYLSHLPIIQIGAYFGIRTYMSDLSLPLLLIIIFAYSYISEKIMRKVTKRLKN